MIGIIIVFGGIFLLYQLGILKFGLSESDSSSKSSGGGLGPFIPSKSLGGGLCPFISSSNETKVIPFKSPHVNRHTYRANPYGMRGRWAEVLDTSPEMKAKIDEIRHNNKLYKEEENILNKKDKEIARTMCEQILSIITTQTPSSYTTSHSTDGVKYGNILKKYTEFGALGYFSYIILDGSDVSDFIGRFFSINHLFNSHQIVEKI